MQEERILHLYEKAMKLPLSPGVYLMKNAQGEIIYVGKSRKLKNRVSSYFANEEHNIKTEKMISHVHDFDYILCDTEMEALTLENTLIKKHAPHFNIRLKDAKSYPYIKITNEEYPRLLVSRERKADHAKYYGPYSSISNAYDIIQTLSKIFHLPTCNKSFPKDMYKDRPCIYYQMGRCSGLCAGVVPVEDYRKSISSCSSILSGETSKIEKMLEQDMQAYADKEQYEMAAKVRDSLISLQMLEQKQKVVGNSGENRDVFAFYQDEVCGVIAVLSCRDGKLQNKNEFVFSSSSLSDDEDLSSWIVSYYQELEDVPQELLLQFNLSLDDISFIERELSKKNNKSVHVKIPIKGDLKKLAEMAYKNAEERAQRYQRESVKEDSTLLKLSKILGLDYLPNRIESYDISEIGNEHITASMVVCNGTKFKNKDYRTFKMKTIHSIDDYGSMREVLSRRLDHIGDGSESLGELPDLILLDGGVGQVHAVKEVLISKGLQIPVFGMVKDEFHKTRALTDGVCELSVALEQSVFVFLYKLQEEVHRVALRATMNAKTKTLTHSTLEKIDGIGPKKAKVLLKCAPYSKLKTASVEELLQLGISQKDAQRLFDYFHGGNKT